MKTLSWHSRPLVADGASGLALVKPCWPDVGHASLEIDFVPKSDSRNKPVARYRCTIQLGMDKIIRHASQAAQIFQCMQNLLCDSAGALTQIFI